VTDLVQTERRGHVLVVSMQREQKRNATLGRKAHGTRPESARNRHE
jgi:hypothetical protein